MWRQHKDVEMGTSDWRMANLDSEDEGEEAALGVAADEDDPRHVPAHLHQQEAAAGVEQERQPLTGRPVQHPASKPITMDTRTETGSGSIDG